MHLDRLDGDEERLGDLAVRGAGRGAFGDPPLARCQRVDPGLRVASHAHAGRSQLFAGPFAHGDAAAVVRERERLAQRLAGGDAFALAPERRTEVAERAGVVEPAGGGRERRDGGS